MTSKPVAFLFAGLGIVQSHSRPRFPTTTPTPSPSSNPEGPAGYPKQFDSRETARAWCREFFDYYNNGHRSLTVPATVARCCIARGAYQNSRAPASCRCCFLPRPPRDLVGVGVGQVGDILFDPGECSVLLFQRPVHRLAGAGQAYVPVPFHRGLSRDGVLGFGDLLVDAAQGAAGSVGPVLVEDRVVASLVGGAGGPGLGGTRVRPGSPNPSAS